MELVDNFLEQEYERLNLDIEFLNETNDVKLTYFFNLFLDLERKYLTKIEDIKRLNQEHKDEISQLQDTILQVKELTEEREHFNFKEENTKLKSKIKQLEQELESTQFELEVCLKNQETPKNDTSSSDTSEDLSESTIEMLILEGFGKIVGAPIHEKIAVILADRARLIEELDTLKNNVPYSQELEQFNAQQTELQNLKQKLEEMNKKLEEDSTSSGGDDFLKIENSKLKQDSLNFRQEVEKLYDEIGIFESETKQLKDENKNLRTEVEDLNNELDELIQYKSNYDHLKKEYDKLSTCLKQHEKLLNDKLSSPRVHNPVVVANKNEEKTLKTPQLELEWIRGENEKLLLDLEKTQTKLNDKINQYNELKLQLVNKDDEMKEFIAKYEHNETTKDDILLLQKKIINLENELQQEKDDHQKSIELGEERLKDLLNRNDSLWSQLSNLDQMYKECVGVIQEQNESLESLQVKNKDLETEIVKLNEDVSAKRTEIQKLEESIRKYEAELQKLNLDYKDLKESSTNENEKNRTKIDELETEINSLNDKINVYEKKEFNFKLDIESLNKEIKFIVAQNEQQNSKMLQDFLSLQEKYAKVNFEVEKLNENLSEQTKLFVVKNEQVVKLENEKVELNFSLEQERRDKNQLLDTIKSMEAYNQKCVDKINELNETIHRVELQKSKLELKAIELENLQTKYDQLNNELNDKRETLSQVLETNSKHELEINNLENRLNETKHMLIKSENVINELTHFKTDHVHKVEENIKLKHECENERLRREKGDQKLDECKDEMKKMKQKISQLQDENSDLKHENIEFKNQLSGVRSKLDLIADKSHTEFEKNSVLQDELNETRKKLEHAECKCMNYSQKFEVLLKKYESRKTKQKNKIERLWDYLQRERAKYKDLLANAQNDLNRKVDPQDSQTYQILVDERNGLLSSLADRDAKIRELKRQNTQLNTKIKLLHDETDHLNEKLEGLIKEKNKLRKELQLNALSTDIFDLTTSSSQTPPIKSNSPPVQLTPRKNTFNSYDHLDRNLNYLTDLNTTSCWDVYYNTGNVNKYALSNSNNNKNEVNNYIRNMTTDINSLASTPRSFR